MTRRLARLRPHTFASTPAAWRSTASILALLVAAALTAAQGPSALAQTQAGAPVEVQAQSQTQRSAPPQGSAADAADGPVETLMPLKGIGHRVRIEPRDQGFRITLRDRNVPPSEITAEEFFERVYREQQEFVHRHWILRFLNISTWTSLVWIGVGLLGQAMFTFRMVLQWLASEKEKRSVVPVAFWWGSLFGGMMLLVYFIWRKDAIGVLGQSTGVLIYARNLYLIYRVHRAPETATGSVGVAAAAPAAQQPATAATPGR